ncbi:hypothetical protein THASP1DRAFT_29875 [Thamnocephalis sphaerospora]|uniref:Uncharacterized protein n=1 Tax=Thamnocephalis sphaerospora TaxID=78915 RepID=A0A4P9XQX7_9FUNG|nr:hypothetical protein THASP1DRAFT_29875 [Thamnocephalis sphaerospora]|eukprot:RKP08322.1 hypothetical protein THASP1DRAFT_29875 [Thamnocephalis sphaerospora]
MVYILGKRDVFFLVLALFWPPVAVFASTGCSRDLLVNLLLNISLAVFVGILGPDHSLKFAAFAGLICISHAWYAILKQANGRALRAGYTDISDLEEGHTHPRAIVVVASSDETRRLVHNAHPAAGAAASHSESQHHQTLSPAAPAAAGSSNAEAPPPAYSATEGSSSAHQKA